MYVADLCGQDKQTGVCGNMYMCVNDFYAHVFWGGQRCGTCQDNAY